MAVAVLVLLCQAGAWVHAAATPHVTCLEHGESVHVGVNAQLDVQSVRAGLASLPNEGVTVAPASSQTATHEHEHCALQGQRSTSVSAPQQVSSSATFVPAPPRAIAERQPALRLLRLAPKTSPPRAPSA